MDAQNDKKVWAALRKVFALSNSYKNHSRKSGGIQQKIRNENQNCHIEQ